jgi:ABC-type nickel/cobalt efflux system permease component RcnA
VTGFIPCPLTTFIVSYALARGMLVAGLTVTAAMTAGMIVTIGGVALAAAFARDRFVQLLARTEAWRHRAGVTLELGSAVAVFGFGAWTALRSL